MKRADLTFQRYQGVTAQVVHPGAQTQPLQQTSQSLLPSWTAGLYISPLPPYLVVSPSSLRSAAVNRIAKTLDSSKQKMCSKQFLALASCDTGARLIVRGYQPEQRWPRLRPVGHPGEQFRGRGWKKWGAWWISLNCIWETGPLAASMNVNLPAAVMSWHLSFFTVTLTVCSSLSFYCLGHHFNLDWNILNNDSYSFTEFCHPSYS